MPADYRVWLERRDEEDLLIEPGVPVDLSEPGVERFYTGSDTTTAGGTASGLPHRDQRYLDDHGLSAKLVSANNQVGLIFSDYPLSSAVAPSTADLLIMLPSGYPDCGPDMFYLYPWVTLTDGQWPDRANHPFDFGGQAMAALEPAQQRMATRHGWYLDHVATHRRSGNGITMRRLVLLDQHEQQLRELLFPASGHEAMAYLLCGSAGPGKQRILSHRVVPMPIEHVRSSSSSHITANTGTLRRLLKTAANDDLLIAVVHSHRPGPAIFSRQDDEDEPKLVELTQNRNGHDTQLISMILAENGETTARLWTSPASNEPLFNTWHRRSYKTRFWIFPILNSTPIFTRVSCLHWVPRFNRP